MYGIPAPRAGEERGKRALNDIIDSDAYRKLLPAVAGRVYLFFGSEDYLKSAAIRATREALCPDPAMAFFNDVVIDATDYEEDRLLDTMAAPPMMTDARLIVLRGFDFTSLRQNEIDDLLNTLRAIEEYDYNCIIIEVAADLIDVGYLPNRPSPLLKKIAGVATPVHFETPTGAKLVRWVSRHFAHFGVNTEPCVPASLIATVGGSMFTLASEIKKLSSFALAKGRNTVTEEDVRQVAAPAVLSDAFALSNAVLEGNGAAALDALAVMKFERIPPAVIMGEISRTFAQMQSARVLFDAGKSVAEVSSLLKLHEYKVRLLSKSLAKTDRARLARIITLAAECDLALKGATGTSNDYSVIEKLVSAI